jgi:predicted nucleotidyltransferase component of viral defense system
LILTESELLREAAESGFRPEILEKVVRLTELLETLRSHPFLKTRIALKGGTALNLFVLRLPRLSVDVDLNYVGSADVEGMNRERPSIEQAIQAVCGRLGITVRLIPAGHAGRKWRLSYWRDSWAGDSRAGRELPPTDSPLARGLGGLAIHWEVFGLRGPGAGCA